MPEYATESRLTQYGIVLALYPSTVAAGIEIQRAPDSGGAADTGNAESIAVVPPGQRTFTDLRGGGTWWYRIRHVFAGATASSWTDWVSGTPTQIPPVLPQIPDVGGWIIKQGRLESTDGSIVLDAPNEAIRMGLATAVMTGTGLFAGSDGSGGTDFRVGDPAGQYFLVDESAGEVIHSGKLLSGGIQYGPLHADGSQRDTNSSTETTLETITVPAGAMGATGVVRVVVFATFQYASGDTFTLRVKFDGTTIATYALTPAASREFKMEVYIANQTASSQRIAYTVTDNDEGVEMVFATPTTVNTATARDITITGQLASGGGLDEIQTLLTAAELLASAVPA